jgi:UDP-N-acetylglucosamine--N-acetylmuramyl-(pentapeptide) pyrophosphoryl-undecaprenol N-acetylglucosamine transferase
LLELHAGSEVLFVGTRGRSPLRPSLESTVVVGCGFELKHISVAGLAGKMSVRRRLRSAASLAIGLPLWQSMVAISRFSPSVVVGTGGFVCGPMILAAWLLSVPTLLVEQNEAAGVTSGLVSYLVDAAAVVSEESAQLLRRGLLRRRTRVEVVGNPVRLQVLRTTREEGCRALGLDPSKIVVLAFGGSVGSLPVNRAFCGALEILAQEGLLKDIEVAHVTGRENVHRLEAGRAEELGIRYHVFDYLDDMHNALAAADIVVSRSGGTALAEITARGIAAITVPWAGAARNHQEQNARRLFEDGAVVMITDADLTPSRLANELRSLLTDEQRRTDLAHRAKQLGRPDAADRVIEIIEDLAAGC